MQTIDRASVEAMYNRAKSLVLTQAWLGKAGGLQFAQGALSELGALLNSTGPAFAAKRDASEGGYRPFAGFEAAWSALPVGAKDFTLVEMQEFLRTQGIEISSDAVSNGNIDAVGNLKNSEVAAVNGHDEHGAARADLDDGSGLHSASPVVCATVAQGGAA